MTKKIVLSYSGGLDTTYCIVYLKQQGYDVYTAFANTGGFSDPELTEIEQNAANAGATKHVTLDVQQKFYTQCLRYLVFGNVLRGQNYPLCVSSERVFQAKAVAAYAKEIGADAVAHGSTGAGNDQVRFDLAFRVYAPGLEIISPIRNQALSRTEETAYLRQHGINWPEIKKDYSVNQGLWGMTVGGKETLTSDQPLPEEAWPYPITETESQKITITFDKGEAVKLNGNPMPPLGLIQELNQLGYAYGVGRGMHIGDTILGTKGRVAFAVPAATMLIEAHRVLEKHTLSKWQSYWKNQLGDWYGMMLHEGQFMEPLMRNIEAFLTSTQSTVSGDVTLEIAPKSFQVLGISSPHDAMQKSGGDYGEAMGQWDERDAVGFIKMLSMAPSLYQPETPSTQAQAA